MNKDIKRAFWQTGLVKKLYKMIMALKDVNPALEMHFEIFNNYDYMVDFVNKLHYVKVKFASAWQSTCLALWWLLTPHSGFRYLQWISCLSDVVGGQIFLAAMVVLLVICGMGIMATSNMSPCRRMACQEHMSRIEKKRYGRKVKVTKRQFIAMMMICSCASSAAMEQEAVLQRIITLTEAATRAAMSAESTLNQVQSMASTSSGPSEGLQAASRILKAPDTFNGDDPMAFASWRFQFTSWLTFGDSRYTTLLEKVESLTSAPSITTYDTPEKELAHKLYAVLTSYLRGRCSHIIKAFAKSRDGFAIWYQLMREFEPTSRQRSLALAQALASYPVFAKDKSCLESILVYEQTVQQFEESSSTTYPDELKVATLMRCCNSKLREFLQLNIKDSSTYVEVREHIMNYERVSKSWTQEQVLKAIQQDPARPDHGGPTPMEIDRVEVKGKGKSKSKSKGKNNSGSGWSSGAWGFGRGRGRGQDSKGKGKKGRGKGKGKHKGKSKNKGKGPNKGKVGQDQCAICYGYGNWSRECPQRPRAMEVNQVQEQPQQQPWTGYLAEPQHVPLPGQRPQHSGLPAHQLPVNSGVTTASSSTFRPHSTSTGSTVRRIFHIGPPSPSSSPSSSTVRTGNVQMVRSDIIFEENIEDSYVNLTETVNEDGDWVILDSGSDVSLLPLHFVADKGSNNNHLLRDCQGGSLAVTGTRYTDLRVEDVSGEEVVLRHEFVVGDVTTSLISLGQLYQLGWKIGDSDGQLCLRDPSKKVEIPVHYRGKSFALKAHVRQVVDYTDSYVRTVVHVLDLVNNNAFFAWGSISPGLTFLKVVGSSYFDPRPAWGSRLPFRSTLIRKRDSSNEGWILVELSQNYMDQSDPFRKIEEISSEIGGQMCEILTIVSSGPHGIEEIGEALEEELHPGRAVPGQPGDSGASSSANPAAVPGGLPPGLGEQDVVYGEGEREEAEAALPPVAPEAIAVADEAGVQDEITLYEGCALTRDSKITDLRAGCKWVGVSQAGSKARLFERIVKAHRTAMRRAALDVAAAMKQYEDEIQNVEVAEIPKQPTARERALHEVTHLPFRPWCQHCVATRSYGDHHATVADATETAEREHPTIQADFFFCEERCEESKYVLLLVDVWTRFVHAEPLKVRNKRSVGEAMARFIGSLGHVGTVEIAVDNENVLVAGMEFCRDVRLRMGFQTITTTNKNYDKARTSTAERMIQTVRNLQKTLISQLEGEAKFRVPGGHCLRYWAVVHAAWLYCRYNIHATLKTTPYQSVTGRPYRGRLANFGQQVLGLDPKAGKYGALWKRGTYLGKDNAGHDVLGVASEVIRTKALRRTANLWSAEEAMGLTIGPWDTTGYTYSHAKTPALPPVLPRLLDQDALDVMAYEGKSDEETGEVHEQEEAPVQQVQPEVSLLGEDERGVPVRPDTTMDLEAILEDDNQQIQSSLSAPASHAGGASGSEPRAESMKRHASLELLEPPKVPRIDEPPVPEPKTKAANTEVRMVYNVEAVITEEVGVEEMWDICPMDYEDADPSELQKGEDEGPPNITPEQLADLDGAAALDEVRKLHDLNVISPMIPDRERLTSTNLVDTTLVYDWRYRDKQWKRRCRIVAREYREGQTNEEQYSPTSTFAAVRALLVLGMLHDLHITAMAMDVKDAFLLVDQKEEMYVVIPRWIQELAQDGATHWLLRKCLPGQRNAALRWHEHFTELCMAAGFEPYPGCPTVMRMKDKTRPMFLSVHVDDILFFGKPEDVKWFKETAGQSLTMKIDCPYEHGSGGVFHYLKKRITLSPEGVLIQPNNTYIPKLISLLKISGRRGKGLPYHSALESYNAELDIEKERLHGEQAALFKSALGLILYIAQDRPDIQFPTKILATYMAHPCIKALAAVKHLALYLAGTETSGILLRRCDPYDTVFDKWSESELVEPDFRQDRSFITMDIFSDSSWGDERSTRKSTTAGMIFVNGCLIHSICRAQATIALSSCEAELYAANTAMVESIYLFQLIQFLMNDEAAVRQRLFLDSTSAKFVVQRSGVGRLKHVSIKHMFLQQLLRQKVFSIHKVPTRINPADLNTKKLSCERRNFLATLAGLFPQAFSVQEDMETLNIRRAQRVVTTKLVQAMQVLAVTLLQGCCPVTGDGLRGVRALHGEAPVQGHGNGDGYDSGWYVFYTEYKIYILVVVLVIFMVLATTCTMYPGRRLGPRRGGHREGGSSSSRPTGGDQGGDDPTGRSRTTSRDRREDPSEEVVVTLHRRLALMFMTVLEGSYTPRERVTPYGINQTLKHLLGAAKSLDDGFYFAVKDALDYLDGPEERKAVKLLGDMVKRVERTHGPLPTENGDMSKMLLQRYKEVLRDAGYPVLRLEEMVYGPDDNWESESSYTVEQSFRADASRSRDSSPDRETGSQRLRRYQQSTMAEVSDPEYWQSLRHFESSSTEEWTHREALQADNGEGEEGQRGEDGEEETLVEPTPEGEVLSEHGARRFNVFEPEGEPSEHGRREGVRYPWRIPELTDDEVNGVRYPDDGIDLSPFSEYEKVCRMCRCLEMRIEMAVVNNMEES